MEYMMVNGYQIPALTLNEPPMPEIGKYGSLRRNFLRENTKIIKVKSNLNLCLDYTSNPKKTERRSAEDLNRLLSYTQSNDKTEHQLYVSGFNCIPQNAYEIMMETKQRWRKPVKDGNILAYHIIQSFSPGEATPDQVHQIGCEFAQRFLADRFE